MQTDPGKGVSTNGHRKWYQRAESPKPAARSKSKLQALFHRRRSKTDGQKSKESVLTEPTKNKNIKDIQNDGGHRSNHSRPDSARSKQSRNKKSTEDVQVSGSRRRSAITSDLPDIVLRSKPVTSGDTEVPADVTADTIRLSYCSRRSKRHNRDRGGKRKQQAVAAAVSPDSCASLPIVPDDGVKFTNIELVRSQDGTICSPLLNKSPSALKDAEELFLDINSLRQKLQILESRIHSSHDQFQEKVCFKEEQRQMSSKTVTFPATNKHRVTLKPPAVESVRVCSRFPASHHALGNALSSSAGGREVYSKFSSDSIFPPKQKDKVRDGRPIFSRKFFATSQGPLDVAPVDKLSAETQCSAKPSLDTYTTQSVQENKFKLKQSDTMWIDKEISELSEEYGRALRVLRRMRHFRELYPPDSIERKEQYVRGIDYLREEQRLQQQQQQQQHRDGGGGGGGRQSARRGKDQHDGQRQTRQKPEYKMSGESEISGISDDEPSPSVASAQTRKPYVVQAFYGKKDNKSNKEAISKSEQKTKLNEPGDTCGLVGCSAEQCIIEPPPGRQDSKTIKEKANQEQKVESKKRKTHSDAKVAKVHRCKCELTDEDREKLFEKLQELTDQAGALQGRISNLEAVACSCNGKQLTDYYKRSLTPTYAESFDDTLRRDLLVGPPSVMPMTCSGAKKRTTVLPLMMDRRKAPPPSAPQLTTVVNPHCNKEICRRENICAVGSAKTSSYSEGPPCKTGKCCEHLQESMLAQQQAVDELREVWNECKKRYTELEKSIEAIREMVTATNAEPTPPPADMIEEEIEEPEKIPEIRLRCSCKMNHDCIKDAVRTEFSQKTKSTSTKSTLRKRKHNARHEHALESEESETTPAVSSDSLIYAKSESELSEDSVGAKHTKQNKKKKKKKRRVGANKEVLEIIEEGDDLINKSCACCQRGKICPSLDNSKTKSEPVDERYKCDKCQCDRRHMAHRTESTGSKWCCEPFRSMLRKKYRKGCRYECRAESPLKTKHMKYRSPGRRIIEDKS